MNITLLFIVLILPSLLYLIYLSFRIYIFIKIIKHHHNKKAGSLDHLKEIKQYYPEIIKRMIDETFEIKIEKKITIKGNLIRGKTNKMVIFSHGFQGTKWDMTRYANTFYNKGWNLVFFDFRNCGDSSGKISSLGGLELADLESVVNWSFLNVEHLEKVVLFGESMGAAVNAVYSSRDERISAIISDSMYCSALKEIRSKLIHSIFPKWFIDRIIADIMGWIRLYPGYEISVMNPEYSLMRTPIPILLIHGDQDMQVPPSMSWTIYKKRKQLAPTRLYLCPHAGFVSSQTTNMNRYNSIINDFLEDNSKVVEFSRFYS